MILSPEIQKTLRHYKQEVDAELQSLLNWWMLHIPDKNNGGFYGEINQVNIPQIDQPNGLVLQSRLLWTFATTFANTGEKKYLDFADAVYNYLIERFSDPIYGGMYWSVGRDGIPVATKKQAYGLAFAIYGLSAYYEASSNEAALAKAIELYHCIEKYCSDKIQGGYVECLQRDWSVIEDVRLSDKDQNAIKSMNTHLHIIEAYTKLYTVSKNDSVKNAIHALLNCFEKHIIHPDTLQQKLFFQANWQPTSSDISYGHDIEAAWLLHESAMVLGDPLVIQKFEKIAVAMAQVVADNTAEDGALYNEFNALTLHLNKGKDWWPQAEAMVGFLNAYELTQQQSFLDHSLASWNLIKKYFIDHIHGEWYWGYDETGKLIKREKAGFWKCPYHNSRACMEVSRRITHLLNSYNHEG